MILKIMEEVNTVMESTTDDDTVSQADSKRPELEPHLKKALRVAYGVGLGYPLIQELIHVLFEVNDRSLTVFYLIPILPLAGLIIALLDRKLALRAKLKLALKHSFGLFFGYIAVLIFIAFVDILHCGFEH